MTRANLNFVWQTPGQTPRVLFHYHNGDQYPEGLLQFFGPDSGTTLLSVPATGRAGDAGFVALRHGRVMAVATLTVRAGRVAHIDSLADPTRLGSLSAVLGV